MRYALFVIGIRAELYRMTAEGYGGTLNFDNLSAVVPELYVGQGIWK